MRRILLTLALLCLLLTGCGTTDPSPHPKSGMPSDRGTESRLRVGDQITVRLDTGGNHQAEVMECVVDENGEISLALIGHVKAAGATASELGERIQASYVPRFYIRCTATVLATTRFFYVGGEVRGPGRQNWTEDMTLTKAINTAGGFTDYANRGKVELTRNRKKQLYNCDDIRQHPERDVPIQPGDSIYVPRSLF
jgi:protein involved in polysaccharide export with SLBB domain